MSSPEKRNQVHALMRRLTMEQLLKQAMHLHKNTVKGLEENMRDLTNKSVHNSKSDEGCKSCLILQQSLTAITEAYKKTIEEKDRTIKKLEEEIATKLCDCSKTVVSQRKNSLKLNRDGIKRTRFSEAPISQRKRVKLSPTENPQNDSQLSSDSSDDAICTFNQKARSSINKLPAEVLAADSCAQVYSSETAENSEIICDINHAPWKMSASTRDVSVPETMDYNENLCHQDDSASPTSSHRFSSTPVVSSNSLTSSRTLTRLGQNPQILEAPSEGQIADKFVTFTQHDLSEIQNIDTRVNVDCSSPSVKALPRNLVDKSPSLFDEGLRSPSIFTRSKTLDKRVWPNDNVQEAHDEIQNDAISPSQVLLRDYPGTKNNMSGEFPTDKMSERSDKSDTTLRIMRGVDCDSDRGSARKIPADKKGDNEKQLKQSTLTQAFDTSFVNKTGDSTKYTRTKRASKKNGRYGNEPTEQETTDKTETHKNVDRISRKINISRDRRIISENVPLGDGTDLEEVTADEALVLLNAKVSTNASLHPDFDLAQFSEVDNNCDCMEVDRTWSLPVKCGVEEGVRHDKSFVFTAARSRSKKEKVDQDHAILNDSFDKVPKPVYPQYAYTDVVRKKNERKKLEGYDCAECTEYYRGMDLTEEELKEKMQSCSRHRGRYIPPATPEGFWEIGFPTTQECVSRGYTKTDTQPGPSRYRRKRQLLKHFSSKLDECDSKPELSIH